jgi:histidinol phosphatase-like enzyme (inositol monophosphatase family)
MTSPEIESRLQLANRIAREAGELTLKYFQTDCFEVEKKSDGSPLTIADQEAEKFLRAEIQNAFPNDAIVGEEFGETKGDSGYCWVLDPIDGTKSFISGVPLYGTMVAVVEALGHGAESEGVANATRKSLIGSVYFPGLDEGIFASVGGGAWHFRGSQQPMRAQVSTTSNLSDSVLVTSEAETFAERGAENTYQQLSDQVYFVRTWGDVYGYMLVATGRVDLMIDPILNVWDAAAVEPIINEAGGKFTDWKGHSDIDAGEAVGSNGSIHANVLSILKSTA